MAKEYTKVCIGCGESFITTVNQHKRCKPTCGRDKNPTRTKMIREHDIEFVGVDGEGVTRPDGSHDYVMLSVGDKTLWNGGKQLTFVSMMEFLWNCHKERPKSRVRGFLPRV